MTIIKINITRIYIARTTDEIEPTEVTGNNAFINRKETKGCLHVFFRCHYSPASWFKITDTSILQGLMFVLTHLLFN